jgi:hypothetical protein
MNVGCGRRSKTCLPSYSRRLQGYKYPCKELSVAQHYYAASLILRGHKGNIIRHQTNFGTDSWFYRMLNGCTGFIQSEVIIPLYPHLYIIYMINQPFWRNYKYEKLEKMGKKEVKRGQGGRKQLIKRYTGFKARVDCLLFHQWHSIHIYDPLLYHRI